MTDPEKSTEKTILDAAKRVFLTKGFDGARMQEIADEAGINKALLHYYFRSKDKLFDAIFEEAFLLLQPRVGEFLSSDKPFIEKIWGFVDMYIGLLLDHPHLPIFIMHELYRNPQRLINIMHGSGIRPEILLAQIRRETEQGTLRPIDPRHLMVNLVGLCIFPFAAKPLLRGLIFGNNEEEYQRFLQERRTEVTLFVMNAIKPE